MLYVRVWNEFNKRVEKLEYTDRRRIKFNNAFASLLVWIADCRHIELYGNSMIDNAIYDIGDHVPYNKLFLHTFTEAKVYRVKGGSVAVSGAEEGCFNYAWQWFMKQDEFFEHMQEGIKAGVTGDYIRDPEDPCFIPYWDIYEEFRKGGTKEVCEVMIKNKMKELGY